MRLPRARRTCDRRRAGQSDRVPEPFGARVHSGGNAGVPVLHVPGLGRRARGGAAIRTTHQAALSPGTSFAGVAVMVGWDGTGAVHPLGAGLALSAAIVYALFIPLIDRLGPA